MELTPAVLQEVLDPPRLYEPVLSGGWIRCGVDDFQVEEIPAYRPEGTGEHLFLWIEKRGLTGTEAINRMARALQISSRDIGMAGQKDRHAVTRQYVSIPRSCESRVSLLEQTGITVLSVDAHSHKLRTGHLRGNLFQLTVRTRERGWSVEDVDRARCRLQQLVIDGFPSYFGTQRFGHGGSTLRDGLALLQGRLSRKRWPFQQQRFMTRLVLSAVQSAVFNLVLAERVGDGSVRHVAVGDVVIRQHGTRPFLFTSEQQAAAASATLTADCLPDAERSDDVPVRLIPAGPMPGPRMLPSAGSVSVMEQRALETLGLDGTEFQRFEKLSSGTRRSMLEFPDRPSVVGEFAPVAECPIGPSGSVTGSDTTTALTLQFVLRSGTYATVLLRELFASVQDATSGTADEIPDDPEMTQG